MPGEYDYVYPKSVQLFEKHNIQIVMFLLCMMQNKQFDCSFPTKLIGFWMHYLTHSTVLAMEFARWLN